MSVSDVQGGEALHPPMRSGSKMRTDLPLGTQEGKAGVVQYAL